MNLYQALLEQDDKQFESNSNALKMTNAEINNALVMHNSKITIKTKGLEDFDFFEDLDKQIGHIDGGGGVIDPNN